MSQKFYANPNDKFEYADGAIGYSPGGSFDCLGPFAKVTNCRIDGTTLRLTCYATGYADTYFSVPACTRYKGKYVSGFFMCYDTPEGRCIRFCVNGSHKSRIGLHPETSDG